MSDLENVSTTSTRVIPGPDTFNVTHGPYCSEDCCPHNKIVDLTRGFTTPISRISNPPRLPRPPLSPNKLFSPINSPPHSPLIPLSPLSPSTAIPSVYSPLSPTLAKKRKLEQQEIIEISDSSSESEFEEEENPPAPVILPVARILTYWNCLVCNEVRPELLDGDILVCNACTRKKLNKRRKFNPLN